MKYNHDSTDIISAVGLTKAEYEESYEAMFDLFNKYDSLSICVQEIEKKIKDSDVLRRVVVLFCAGAIYEDYKTEFTKEEMAKQIATVVKNIFTDAFKEEKKTCDMDCKKCPNREDCNLRE